MNCFIELVANQGTILVTITIIEVGQEHSQRKVAGYSTLHRHC